MSKAKKIKKTYTRYHKTVTCRPHSLGAAGLRLLQGLKPLNMPYKQLFLLVYNVGQASAGFELNDLLGSDFDFLLGSGVDTLTGILLYYLEGAETDEGNLVAFLQGVSDGIESCIESGFGINLGKISLLGDCLY